jgi:diaminopimelate decarboxylase
VNRRQEKILQAAVSEGHFNADHLVAAFVDTDALRATVTRLERAFPDHFTHTFAAKANTMSRALATLRDLGMGCEVASPGELQQALKAGYEPGRIVYDEPAKTVPVLSKVLGLGISLNIDNFQEFGRVRELQARNKSPSRIGFRINPQVGAGSISAMSTATRTSKFGIALEDEGNREMLISTYLENPWLTSIHTHVGSQGCSLDLMTAGVRKVVTLAEQINEAAGTRQVEVVDIGGGLPVNFDSDDVTPTFSDYADVLKESVPELFDGRYRVKTEFGRSIFAKNGFIATRVEYTKSAGGRQIAITHAGAQIATRTVFMPDFWRIRLSVADASGKAKHGNEVMQDVAGPLCFAGDMIGTDRLLPEIEPGDYVVLHDTGAYYFSNPFLYNALAASAVYGVQAAEDGPVSFDVWRRQQTLDDTLAVIG